MSSIYSIPILGFPRFTTAVEFANWHLGVWVQTEYGVLIEETYFSNTSNIPTFKTNWHRLSIWSLLCLYQAFKCQVYEYKNWSIPSNPKSQIISLLLPGVGNSTIIRKKIFISIFFLYLNSTIMIWSIGMFQPFENLYNYNIFLLSLLNPMI